MNTSGCVCDIYSDPGDTSPATEVGQVSEAMEVDTQPLVSASCDESHDPEWVEHLRSVDRILVGEVTVGLHQEFLIRNNHTDLQILKNIKVYPSHFTHHTHPHTLAGS